jgi:Fe2+ or Zn2+ uptake regulation protein
MNDKDKFIRLIHAKGLRATRQRLLVLEELGKSQDHLDAVAIHQRVRAQDKRIGLATVYRTLALLKELGLIQEHRLGEEHSHYEITRETLHYHFACTQCGRVIEFEAPEVTEATIRLQSEEGVQINEIHLLVHGRCKTCQHNQENR